MGGLAVGVDGLAVGGLAVGEHVCAAGVGGSAVDLRASDGIGEFLLAFADDEHLMGQQHTEWIGAAPFLEEDLAFSSIGQDEFGHAVMLYEMVLQRMGTEATDAAVDALAYGRSSAAYRSCHITERKIQDWAEALVRHWVYDTFEKMRWQLLAESSHTGMRCVVERALREERFHLMHADALLDKLLESAQARRRIVDALEALVPFIAGLCSPVEGEAAAIAEGLASASTADLLEPLTQATQRRFGHDLSVSADRRRVELGEPSGSQAAEMNSATPMSDPARRCVQPLGAVAAPAERTTRSADFEPLMARMREVFDYDPNARW